MAHGEFTILLYFNIKHTYCNHTNLWQNKLRQYKYELTFPLNSFVCRAQATPPYILKRGGLECSGQIWYSYDWKTKRIEMKLNKEETNTFIYVFKHFFVIRVSTKSY